MSCFLLMGIIDLFSIYHASLSFCGPLGAQLKKFCFKGEVVFVSMPASHSLSQENDSVERSHNCFGLKSQ